MCPTIYVYFRGATSNKNHEVVPLFFIGFLFPRRQCVLMHNNQKTLLLFLLELWKNTFYPENRFMANGNFPFLSTMFRYYVWVGLEWSNECFDIVQ